ncbi:MAG: AbrB/MazE/SpoVT family DNA-binding domain-containing protein [Candidatus Nanohaloarchaea archaeon]
MSEVRKVGDRGQVTIPKRIRQKENIRGGDSLEFIDDDGEIKIRKQNAEKEKLKEGYIANSDRDLELAEEWKPVSSEADENIDE